MEVQEPGVEEGMHRRWYDKVQLLQGQVAMAAGRATGSRAMGRAAKAHMVARLPGEQQAHQGEAMVRNLFYQGSL